MIYGYLDPKNNKKRQNVQLLTTAAGGKCLEIGTPIPTDTTAVIFQGILRGGGELFRTLLKYQIPFYCIDNSYFNENRFQKFRITKNGWINPYITNRNPDRSPNIILEDWREKNGEYVLFLKPTETTLFANRHENWVEKTLHLFKEHKVKIREKPNDGSKLGVGLDSDLSKAYLVVSHSSNVLIQAMCKGIRTWTDFGPTRQINNLDNFDRQKVINHFAYSEFTQEEMYNGYAWRILNEKSTFNW